MKEDIFEGFTPETIDFMWQLRFNNNKEWMDKNRDTYKRVLKQPMDLFAREMNERILSFGAKMNTVPVVSRVNRDIRFSKNKAPYKENKWVVFKKTDVNRWQESPIYYFELFPESYSYGMGFWNATPDYMKNFRKKIDSNPFEFERLADAFEKQTIFHLEGEDYKRKLSIDKTDFIMKWYQKKSFYTTVNKPLDELVFSHKLIDVLEKDLCLLYDLYCYMIDILAE